MDLPTTFGPGGPIARKLRQYEERREQREMALAVQNAIRSRHHLIVEAGTGVGKSLGYLIPAIEAAVEMGEKIVVSTHTIALQEQLVEKDIPLLQAALGQEFAAVLVKGRSNYASLRRLKVATARPMSLFNDPRELEDLERVQNWAALTNDGSLADFEREPSRDVWSAVRSEHDNCLGRSCPTHEACFYFKARRRAQHAQILVVNHHLYFSDLVLRDAGAEILPEHSIVIFDEAHTLESIASEHLGWKVTRGMVTWLLNSLMHEDHGHGVLAYLGAGDCAAPVDRARQECDRFFAELRGWREKQAPPNGRIHEKLPFEVRLPETLRRLAQSLREFLPRVNSKEQEVELVARALRADDLADSMDVLVNANAEGCVFWAERNEARPTAPVDLVGAPVDVGDRLRSLLFAKKRSVILTSATLSVGEERSFAHLRQRLGIDDAQELRLGSPFDYRTQVKIHVPGNMPEPGRDDSAWERALAAKIVHYTTLTSGNAFVLFTSLRTLDSVYRQTKDELESSGLVVLKQGEGVPRTKMVERFRKQGGCVLFGAESFWQGVDVPGDALQNVIITRLPFLVPTHPLVEARSNLIQARGGDPFREYSLPEAVLKLRQGFGRLVRRASDHGIVVILDSRILTKSYGKTFLQSLPDCEIIVD
jgi:ATP-dependent DNA helicase DinG